MNFSDLIISFDHPVNEQTAVKEAVSHYVIQLNCSEGAIFKRKGKRHVIIARHPDFFMPQHWHEFNGKLDAGAFDHNFWYREILLEERTYHVLKLKEYGFLVLVSDDPLPENFSHGIKPLISNLASMLMLIAERDQHSYSIVNEIFLTNMGHEIRTPLNAVIGMIRQIAREPLSSSQNFSVRNAFLASQHLLSLFNNVMDVTKIISGQITLDKHPLDLRQMVNDAVSIFYNTIQEKNLQIRALVFPEIASGYLGDSARIQQILVNMIDNAVKYTQEGSITVECQLAGAENNLHHLRFVISDTGPGMEDYLVENLQKKSPGVDYFTIRNYGGGGLGITITCELVRLLNGSIHFKSKKDSGTVVEILLDLEKSRSAILDPFSPDNFDGLKNKKILLVEDNDINQLVALNSLKWYKAQVTSASDGTEAIELLKKECYDLILMDLQMPGMGGIEATRIIRKEMGIKVPIIALTAHSFKAEIDRCMDAGMNDYIIKPYNEKGLMETILANIHGTGLRENHEQEPEKIQAKTPMYDLGNILKFSRGNQEFIKKMIVMFIEQSPVALHNIKIALEGNDMEAVKKIAHKVKPTFDNFCNVSLMQNIRIVESLASQKAAAEDFNNYILQMEEVLEEVIQGLKKEIRD